jgi:hypothetical protein
MVHGTVLITDDDFNDAMANAIEVSASQEGKHMGSGRILSHNEHSVRMVSSWVFKDGCEFIVCLLVR